VYEYITKTKEKIPALKADFVEEALGAPATMISEEFYHRSAVQHTRATHRRRAVRRETG
jgi:hypothetical protein